MANYTVLLASNCRDTVQLSLSIVLMKQLRTWRIWLMYIKFLAFNLDLKLVKVTTSRVGLIWPEKYTYASTKGNHE